MKLIVKTLLIIVVVGTMVSCKSTFNGTETMEVQDNRNALYQEIISNPSQFNELIGLAQQDEVARKIMMQSHMQMMESGKMKAMMENNPEMQEENPEMKDKMQSKMLEKMLESPEGRKMLLQKMYENKEIQAEMREKMMGNSEMKNKMKHTKEDSKEHKHNK